MYGLQITDGRLPSQRCGSARAYRAGAMTNDRCHLPIRQSAITFHISLCDVCVLLRLFLFTCLSALNKAPEYRGVNPNLDLPNVDHGLESFPITFELREILGAKMFS
jgi:hypothetical protein